MDKTPATLNDIETAIRPGPTPDKYLVENISSPQLIADILHKTADLTDEAFYDLVNDIGGRTALLVLRHKAINGDVKALELYFKIVKEDKASRATKETARSVTPAVSKFIPKAR